MSKFELIATGWLNVGVGWGWKRLGNISIYHGKVPLTWISTVLRIFFSMWFTSSMVELPPKFESNLFISTPPNPSKLEVMLISAKGSRSTLLFCVCVWYLSRKWIEEKRLLGEHLKKFVTLMSRSTKPARSHTASDTVTLCWLFSLATLWKIMLDEDANNVRGVFS